VSERQVDIRREYEARKEAHQRRAEERKCVPLWWLKQRDPIARFTKWLAILTALLVVATIINAYILLVTDHTLRRTMVNGQRAYVAPKAVRFDPDSVRLDLQNSGSTPADDVRSFNNWEWRSAGDRLDFCKKFNFPERKQCPEGDSTGSLIPGNPVTTENLVCNEVGPTVKWAVDSELDLYLYGEIRYRDIFKADRRTTFCYRINKSSAVICGCHNERDP
jgi:hypothetical protein